MLEFLTIEITPKLEIQFSVFEIKITGVFKITTQLESPNSKNY